MVEKKYLLKKRQKRERKEERKTKRKKYDRTSNDYIAGNGSF